MRRHFLIFAASLILSAIAPLTAAQAAELGRDYTILAAPIGTDSGQKIEVAEFFWYRCPHCFKLEPSLNAWIKTLPTDVAIRRIPAVLNADWAVQAKAWYAMEALGVTDQYHDALFNAIHLNGLDSRFPANIFDWAARVGMNKQAFENAYNSFGVQSKVMRANQLTRDAQITGVPSFVVDGQYVTSVALTGSEEALFHTLNDLIVLARKNHSHGQP